MRRHVYFYTHVERAFEVVAPLISGEGGLWLPGPATAQGEGWLVALSAQGALPSALATRTVIVTLGPPTDPPGNLLRSLRWRSAAADPVFPTLEADLEVSPLDGSGCQLSLMGTYRPPLAVVGGIGDRLHGHRVAEACVRRFVLDIAQRVQASTLSA